MNLGEDQEDNKRALTDSFLIDSNMDEGDDAQRRAGAGGKKKKKKKKVKRPTTDNTIELDSE